MTTEIRCPRRARPATSASSSGWTNGSPPESFTSQRPGRRAKAARKPLRLLREARPVALVALRAVGAAVVAGRPDVPADDPLGRARRGLHHGASPGTGPRPLGSRLRGPTPSTIPRFAGTVQGQIVYGHGAGPVREADSAVEDVAEKALAEALRRPAAPGVARLRQDEVVDARPAASPEVARRAVLAARVAAGAEETRAGGRGPRPRSRGRPPSPSSPAGRTAGPRPPRPRAPRGAPRAVPARGPRSRRATAPARSIPAGARAFSTNAPRRS